MLNPAARLNESGPGDSEDGRVMRWTRRTIKLRISQDIKERTRPILTELRIRQGHVRFLLRIRTLTTFGLPPETYTVNQVRYDLCKMKAHGLIEMKAQRYCHRLTVKGSPRRATVCSLSQARLRPLANSLFHHRPNDNPRPLSKFETRLSQSRSRYSECPRHGCRLTEC